MNFDFESISVQYRLIQQSDFGIELIFFSFLVDSRRLILRSLHRVILM